jgi:molybdopterin-binding protein
VTREADRELGLTKGDRALAIIETADVIVGKE